MKIVRLVKALINEEFWISIFVVSYIALALFWGGAKFVGLVGLKDKIAPYVSIFGLDQNWALFSPTVREINLHNLAVVSFADGSLKLYEWPRMDKLDAFEKIKMEKYRKMLDDCLPWAQYSDLWPSQARFVARANYNPANQPERVLLSYLWGTIPPPHGLITPMKLPGHDELKNYFVYQVQPADLLLKGR